VAVRQAGKRWEKSLRRERTLFIDDRSAVRTGVQYGEADLVEGRLRGDSRGLPDESAYGDVRLGIRYPQNVGYIEIACQTVSLVHDIELANDVVAQDAPCFRDVLVVTLEGIAP
jgi:hypothetical protein